MLWSHRDHPGLCPWAVSLNPRKGSTTTREVHDQSLRSTGKWSWSSFMALERMSQFVYIIGAHVSMNRKITTNSIYLPIKRELNVIDCCSYKAHRGDKAFRDLLTNVDLNLQSSYKLLLSTSAEKSHGSSFSFCLRLSQASKLSSSCCSTIGWSAA